MAILPKAVYIKIPITFMVEIEKSTQKLHLEEQRTRIARPILSKKSNTGDITIPNLKIYYRATALKPAWYWHKNRYEDQWDRIENPDMNPCIYTHLIFDKEAKII
jgi:hypothetical protein